jgi:mono/diheme cytochrome c family protein
MRSSVIILLLVSSSLAQPVGTETAPVTVVAGESWLEHLHRPLNVTSMGKTWRLGPPAGTTAEESQSSLPQPGTSPQLAGHTVTLHGVDLYRMNCRGCHGESGLGAPPEIGSVINPVRATSVPLVLARMKGLGMAISRRQAAELAEQAKNTLLERLHKGGQEMPPFSYLRDAEVRSVVAYLKELAGVPGAEHEQITVKEPRLRVGELIVKSTCHVCHSAAGSNPSPQELLDGAIPPLNALTTRTSRPELVLKVTNGATVNMGTPTLPYRGRMPVFYYLSREEAADVYLYLTSYPPFEPGALGASFSSDSGPINIPSHPREEPLVKGVVLLVAVGWIVLLLGVFAWITVRQFKTLSAGSAARKTRARTRQWKTISPAMTLVITDSESFGTEPEPQGWTTERKNIS